MNRSGTILVVDDSKESLRLLVDMLTAAGFKVRPADSGELALASAENSPPDLMLLDVRMPGMDGFEVCRRMKLSEKTRNVPVLFLSGAMEVEDRTQGFDLGAVDFVTKPFQKSELVARVQTHLELGRLRNLLEREVAEKTMDLEVANTQLRAEIAAREQAQETQAKLEFQLHQAQKLESLGILASGIAHYMNNVLAAILGLASAHLEIQPAGSPAHRAFETIYKASVRGRETIKGLLGFARQGPLETGEVDVNGILREELDMLDSLTTAKVSLNLDLARDLHPILGDRRALMNCFLNLFANAVDAMPGKGALNLRTRNVEGNCIEILVEDAGCGMAKPILERAMDPFFTTKEEGKGTGLGLSVVYATVKAHRGQMEIESEPGQGTRVWLRFPRLGQPEAGHET